MLSNALPCKVKQCVHHVDLLANTCFQRNCVYTIDSLSIGFDSKHYSVGIGVSEMIGKASLLTCWIGCKAGLIPYKIVFVVVTQHITHKKLLVVKYQGVAYAHFARINVYLGPTGLRLVEIHKVLRRKLYVKLGDGLYNCIGYFNGFGVGCGISFGWKGTIEIGVALGCTLDGYVGQFVCLWNYQNLSTYSRHFAQVIWVSLVNKLQSGIPACRFISVSATYDYYGGTRFVGYNLVDGCLCWLAYQNVPMGVSYLQWVALAFVSALRAIITFAKLAVEALDALALCFAGLLQTICVGAASAQSASALTGV